jgi:hypothetical protein
MKIDGVGEFKGEYKNNGDFGLSAGNENGSLGFKKVGSKYSGEFKSGTHNLTAGFDTATKTGGIVLENDEKVIAGFTREVEGEGADAAKVDRLKVGVSKTPGDKTALIEGFYNEGTGDCELAFGRDAAGKTAFGIQREGGEWVTTINGKSFNISHGCEFVMNAGAMLNLWDPGDDPISAWVDKLEFSATNWVRSKICRAGDIWDALGPTMLDHQARIEALELQITQLQSQISGG